MDKSSPDKTEIRAERTGEDSSDYLEAAGQTLAEEWSSAEDNAASEDL